MNRLKYWLQLSVVILLVLAFTACGSNGADATTTAPQATNSTASTTQSTGSTTTGSQATESSSATTESSSTSSTVITPTVANTIDISYVLGANNTIAITYTVKGNVNFCGMEGYVEVPQGFTFNSLTQGNGATANFKDGKVYFMFTSNSGQNVTTETLLFTLNFTYADSVTTANFATTVSDIYDQTYQKVSFSIIGEQIKIKEGSAIPNPVTYTVIFKDYSGATLGTTQVKSGETAVAPVTPVREGYTFAGWSDTLTNVTSDKTVTANYTFNGGNNIVDISCAFGANNTVTITYAMKGTVNFCGMEGYIGVPQGFTFNSLTQGNGATANFKDGKVYFMFTSNNGQNVTTETILFTLNFTYADSVTSTNFATTVSDIYDQNYQNVAFSVIGTQIKFK